MSSTSDEWLLALLDEKPPEEMTPSELSLLRERATSSPGVREAIAKRIQIEEALHATFGDPQVTSESIIRRVRAARRRRAVSVGIALLLLASASGFWWLANQQERRVDRAWPPAVANHETADPAVLDAEGDRRSGARRIPVEASKSVTIGQGAPSVEQSGDSVDPEVTAVSPSFERWESALGDEAPVIPFAQSAFAGFGDSVPGFDVTDELTPSELKRWIEPVPGRPFAVNEGQWRGQTFAGLDGIAKLLPSWRDDAVLRIAPFDTNEFAIHFWNGEDGCSIRFYSHQRPQLLAVYATKRAGGEPTPKPYQLISTDGGSYSRANAGALEIRYQNRQIVVTRGAVPLLIAPMSAKPAEVYFEAKTRLRVLAMHRGEAAPVPAGIAHITLAGGVIRDDQEWLTSAEPPAQFERAAGLATLAATAAVPGPRRMTWAAIPLRLPEGTGLCEAIFRLDSLTTGTGLYLGNAEGVPIHTVFASENNSAEAARLGYGWTSRDGSVPEPRWRWDVDPKNEITPAAGSGTWVKLLVGPGGFKTYFSGDGQHWGPAARSPERAVRGDFASIGVFAIADGQPRSIAVTHAEVRELTGIVAIADAKLRERVPLFGETPLERPADWMTWAIATRPADADLDDWLMACGVETLRRGATDAVSRDILSALIRNSIASDRPLAESLALMHDAALISDLWNDQSRAFSLAYEQLSRKIVRGGRDQAATASALESVENAYLTCPIWTENRMWAAPPATLRDLVANVVWFPTDTGVETARRFTSYLTPAHPDGGWSMEEEKGLARLAAWSTAFAASDGGRLDGAGRFGWQHPLATEPGREGSTIAAELRTALDTGAYEDAARLLSTLSELPDLVPAIGDPARYVPPAGLIEEAARQHPELIRTLTERFGDAALIRVRQAMSAGDERAVRLAAIRYYGTAAAAEAEEWLGESALAAGRFAEAEEHFSNAGNIAVEGHHESLIAKRRLAAALAGESVSAPLTEPVSFGTRTLNPGEFDQLIDELKSARSSSVPSQEGEQAEIPAATPVLPQPGGRFQGDVGRNPDRGEFRRFDWAGRQISVVIDRGVVYLTNRFQVVAYDPKRKSPWWTTGLGGEQGDAHSLPNVAFKPVIRNENFVVRRLTNHGPELACLSITDGGKVRWRSDAQRSAISDPLLDQDLLTLLTTPTGIRGGGPVTISLTRLRLDDGALVSSSPLIVLNQGEADRPAAQLLELDNSYLFITQGTVGRCDSNGNLAWLRRLPYLPSPADLDSDQISMGRPFVDGEHVYLASPGSRAVCCLDIRTGQLVWSSPLGEMEKIVALFDDRILVRTHDAILGLDRSHGGVVWTFRHADLLEGTLSDADSVLVTARTTLGDKLDGLSLIELDPADGTVLSEQLVRVQRNENIQCGPLFVHDGTLWAFVGEGWRDPKRTLVEFVSDPQGLAVVHSQDSVVPDAWQSNVERQTSLNTGIVLPGWTPIGSQAGGDAKFGASLVDEFRGETAVLLTRAGRARATRFVRNLTPESPSKRLVARLGRDDDAGWVFRVLADGKLLASEAISKQTAPDGWRTVTIDLDTLVQRPVVLTIDQSGPADNPAKDTKAYWKRVTLE